MFPEPLCDEVSSECLTIRCTPLQKLQQSAVPLQSFVVSLHDEAQVVLSTRFPVGREGEDPGPVLLTFVGGVRVCFRVVVVSRLSTGS